MPRYRVETFLDPDATVGCTAREWRVRWAAGELRRQGIRVRFDRVLRGPEGRSCLFLFEAASARETALVAELAELDGFRVVEEPRAAALS